MFGFVGSKCDSYLFIYTHQKHTVHLLVSVNDIIITSNSISLIQQLTSKLNTAFSLKQLGHLDYFLGLEIKYLANNSILGTQSKYICDLLHKLKWLKHILFPQLKILFHFLIQVINSLNNEFLK